MTTTTTASKAVNYTAEQVTMILEAAKEHGGFINNAIAEGLASVLGKSVRSIVAKASREGCYKAAERTSKSGGEIIKKDALCDKLALLVGLTDNEADSLSKATKTCLLKLIDAIQLAKVE